MTIVFQFEFTFVGLVLQLLTLQLKYSTSKLQPTHPSVRPLLFHTGKALIRFRGSPRASEKNECRGGGGDGDYPMAAGGAGRSAEGARGLLDGRGPVGRQRVLAVVIIFWNRITEG